jgi:hypothetical protein
MRMPEPRTRAFDRGWRCFGRRALFVVAVAMVGCNKAKEPYDACAKLEAAGQLGEALTACENASQADPATEYGKLAAEKASEIQAKLDEIVPPTVTMDWCARLRDRLQHRLSADAQVKYGGAGGDVGTVIHDNVLNVEYNCRQALGHPTAGFWTCRWNETLDNYKDCDALEK